MSNILASKWQFKASGTILPARAIAVHTTVSTATQAVQAATIGGKRIVGVTKNHAKFPVGSYENTAVSGVAAEAGDALDFWGPGEIGYLTLGGSIVAADLSYPLVSDADGKGVTAGIPGAGTVGKYTIGYPLALGVSGDIIPVLVWPENIVTA